jgi:hypothetical protein
LTNQQQFRVLAWIDKQAEKYIPTEHSLVVRCRGGIHEKWLECGGIVFLAFVNIRI